MRNFRIEELEERIAPAAIGLGSVINAAQGIPGLVGVADTGAAGGNVTLAGNSVGVNAGAANLLTVGVPGVGASVGVAASTGNLGATLPGIVDLGSLGL